MITNIIQTNKAIARNTTRILNKTPSYHVIRTASISTRPIIINGQHNLTTTVLRSVRVPAVIAGTTITGATMATQKLQGNNKKKRAKISEAFNCFND